MRFTMLSPSAPMSSQCHTASMLCDCTSTVRVSLAPHQSQSDPDTHKKLNTSRWSTKETGGDPACVELNLDVGELRVFEGLRDRELTEFFGTHLERR